MHELQEAYLQTSRDLKEAKMRTQAIKTERRRTEVTIDEVQRVVPDTRLFRAIGRWTMLDWPHQP